MTAAEMNPGAVSTARGMRQENKSMSDPEPTALLSVLDGIADGVLDRVGSGTYVPDDESVCANEFVDSLDTGQRGLLLQELLDEKAWHIALAECQLDEAAPSTYSAINGIGMILRAAVDTQGEQDQFLRRLVADSIRERASVARLVRQLDARRAQGRFDPRVPVCARPGEAVPMPCDATCGPAFCAEACAAARWPLPAA